MKKEIIEKAIEKYGRNTDLYKTEYREGSFSKGFVQFIYFGSGRVLKENRERITLKIEIIGENIYYDNLRDINKKFEGTIEEAIVFANNDIDRLDKEWLKAIEESYLLDEYEYMEDIDTL